MKKAWLTLFVSCVASFLAAGARAENAVTWTLAGLTPVSAPCGDTPSNACGTLQEALENTLAGGEVRFTGPSGRTGAVLINKSVTIDGGATAPVVAPPSLFWPGQPSVIEIGTQGIDVILRNLTVDARWGDAKLNGIGAGFGRTITIENCTIVNYGGHGILDSRRAGSLTVRRSSIGVRYPRTQYEEWRSSISIEPFFAQPQGGTPPPLRILVEDSELFGNSFAGLYVGSARATVVRTTSHDNPRGVVATSAADVSMIDCVIHANDVGLRHADSTVRLYRNTFTSNAQQIWSDGAFGTIYTAGANFFDTGSGVTLVPQAIE